jgi:FkbM family methyltransferase
MNVDRALRGLRHVRRIGEVASCVHGSPEWWSLVPGYLGLAGLTYPRTFSTRTGASLRLETFHDLVTAWIIFFRREYRVDPKARFIVDAGANIGAFSLYAALHARDARVLALEPFPSTAARLRSTIETNGLASRVSMRPWALSGADGTKRMLDGDGPSQSRGTMDDGASDGLAVEGVSLATLFEREKIERVDLLKMDIEGAEHDVLMSAPTEILQRVGTLALEYHPNASKEPLFRALRGAGFDLMHDSHDSPNSGVAEFRQTRTQF